MTERGTTASADAGTRRRVLFAINDLSRGGAETQLMGVVRAAVASGHEVGIATLLPANDFADQIAELGVRLWAPAPTARSWSVSHMIRLASILRAWRPQVTVAFLFQATLYMRLVNVLVRPERRISSIRNERLESRLRSVLYRATCAADDHIVVNSESGKRSLQASRTIPRSSQVSVIYNGLDTDLITARVRRSRCETRASLGLHDDDIVLLGVGRLSAQKNWASLLQALTLQTDHRVRCLVAGEGKELTSLSALSDQLELGERVQFLGLRADVPDLLTASDCLVLSSLYEGTPNVVLEALALDVPVISTDVGACAELLCREHDTLVPVGDHQALGQAIAGVGSRRSVPAEGGSAPAIVPAVARFAWSRIGSEWVDLVEGRPPAPRREPDVRDTARAAAEANSVRRSFPPFDQLFL